MLMMTKPCIIRFMGSLTALLVLASMMPVFTGDLPKASYTKVMQDLDDHFVMAYDDVFCFQKGLFFGSVLEMFWMLS